MASVYDLPPSVQGVIARCRAGQTLVVSHDRRQRKTYALTPSGRAVDARAAEAAIATPYMQPRADGLFGVEVPLSWSAR